MVPLWEFREITKRFPGVVANDRVSLALHAGEIHGLMGENGSGKSTLIKMLSGAYQPTERHVASKDGAPVALASPAAAQEAGIATVFQEFSVVPTLDSCREHLPWALANSSWVRGLGHHAIARPRCPGAMDVAIDVDAALGRLSVAEQQLVEIAKALQAGASMLILDEPTTALGSSEIATAARPAETTAKTAGWPSSMFRIGWTRWWSLWTR